VTTTKIYTHVLNRGGRGVYPLKTGWGEPTVVLLPARNRSRANREIGCQTGDLILGSPIDRHSNGHDNARKSGMKEYEGCWDRPPLNDMAPAAHIIVEI
jgi:hypothetical protein